MRNSRRLFLRRLEERAVPATFTVDTLLDVVDAGDNLTSLREAVAAANAAPGADTIAFAVTGSITLTGGELLVGDSLLIDGPGTDKLTVSGNFTGRVFQVNGPGVLDVEFARFTIADGKTTGTGTGFGNTANDGGGILTFDERLTLRDVALVNNEAVNREGGAIAVDTLGRLALVNTTVSGNKSTGVGGGVYFLQGGALSVTGSTITGNSSANGEGGGIYFYGLAIDGSLDVVNSTVSANKAATNGGGIVVNTFNGTLNVRNSTVAFNEALIGGGIAVTGKLGEVALENTIVSGNVAAAGPQLFTTGTVSARFSNIASTADVSTFRDLGGNQIGTDPLLDPALANNGGPTLTHALLAGSPAINAGTAVPGVNLDQRGQPRAFGTPDIGAVEVATAGTPTATAALNNVTAIGTGDYTFTVTFADDTAIDAATLMTGNLTVSGPGFGAPVAAEFVSVDPPGSGTPRLATYKFAPPAGGWAAANAGVYTVSTTAANAVTDDKGVSVPAGELGAFRVAIGKTFVVTTDADDGPGSLRQAVRDANANAPATDTITFNLPAVPATIALSGGQLQITDSLTVTGPGTKADLTLNGNVTNRVFLIAAPGVAAVNLANLTVVSGSSVGGFTGNRGGAISIYDEIVTITNAAFTGNSVAGNARGGGAIAVQGGGSLTLSDVEFSGNVNNSSATTLSGGGAILMNGGTLTADLTTFAGNTSAQAGGAIDLLNGAALTLTRSTVSGNTAKVGGGVNLNGGAAVTVETSSFLNNSTTTGSGGGIYATSTAAATVRAVNSTFVTNTAFTSGGAIAVAGAVNLELFNSTLTQNTATAGSGGGVARLAGTGATTVASTILSGNAGASAKDLSGGTAKVNFSALGDTLGFTFDPASGDNLPAGVDLKLLPLDFNGGPTQNFKPAGGSPLRDKGSNPLTLGGDQRADALNFPRLIGPAVDIGSVESFDPSPTASGSFPNVTVAGGVDYTFGVTFADGQTGINTSKLINNNKVIRVTGPNGFDQLATYVSINDPVNGTPRTVTYKIAAPDNAVPGQFDASDNGTYTVAVEPAQVFDLDTPTPNEVPPGAIGSFQVTIATVLVVDTAVDVVDPGDGKLSLREAIEAANLAAGTADTITFGGPEFAADAKILLQLGQLPTVTDSLTISGPTAVKVTIDANAASRHFALDGPGVLNVRIENLALVNGYTTGASKTDRGGSIFIQDENLTLVNCDVSNNVNDQAAGSNIARGGAIGAAGASNLVIQNSTLTNNKVNQLNANSGGGAIQMFNGTLLVEDSVITGNVTKGAGGAVFAYYLTSVTFRRSVIANNRAEGTSGIRDGGGILLRPPTSGPTAILIESSTISGNVTATGRGGGVAVNYWNQAKAGSTLVLRNSTVVLNTAGSTLTGNGQGGGGVRITAGGPDGVTFEGTVVAGNTNATATDVSQAQKINGSNNLIGVADTLVFTGTGNQTGTKASPLDAKLAPLAANGSNLPSHLPLLGSPLINAGSANGLTTDQRGQPREVGGRADIGAVEAPVRIAGITVDDGTAQRSLVASLTVTFDGTATIGTGAFVLARTGPGGKTGPVTGLTVDLSGSTATQTVAKLTWAADPDFAEVTGSLIDGNYELTVAGAKVTSAGVALDGDDDGLPGGDGGAKLFRLFGDADGDRDVDFNDFLAFRGVFGQPSGPSGPARFFNSDGNGAIDFNDFLAFRTRFGLTLVP